MPGQTLQIQADIISHTAHETKLKVQGAVDGKSNLSARLVMGRFNLADGNPSRASADGHVIRQMRMLFVTLYSPGDQQSAASTIGAAVGEHPALNPASH